MFTNVNILFLPTMTAQPGIERARLPIHWFFALLGVAAGALISAMGIGMWVSSVDTATKATSVRVDAHEMQLQNIHSEISTRLEKMSDSLHSIDLKVTRIDAERGSKR